MHEMIEAEVVPFLSFVVGSIKIAFYSFVVVQPTNKEIYKLYIFYVSYKSFTKRKLIEEKRSVFYLVFYYFVIYT